MIILIQFKNKSVAIMQYLKEESSEADIQAEVDKSKFDQEVESWRVITQDEIPTDRTFRNAWIDTGVIDIDMKKAREIKKDTFRQQRATVFPKLDTEYMIAIENKDEAEMQRITTLKKELRDITKLQNIELAQTPEELKAIDPKILKI